MSLFGLFTRKKQKLYAAMDIGSHMIRVLIFEGDGKDGVPRIVKKMAVKLPPAYDRERIFKRAREMVFAMVKELERVPERITVALGPHLVEHSFKTWTNPHVSIRKKLTRKELSFYFKNLLEQNRSKELFSLSYPQGVLLNGYKIGPKELEASDKPITVLSPEVDLSFEVLVLSFPQDIGKTLSDMKESLGGMPIEFVPLISAIREAVVRVFGAEDAFLVDVGGEETTLIFLGGGEIREVTSFPLGIRHFLREIASFSSASFDEAEDIKRQYVQGMLSVSGKKELDEVLKKEAEAWKKKFIEALDYFYRLGPVPPKIFLFGGGANLPEIEGALRSQDWFKKVSYLDSAELRVLKASSLFQGNTLAGFVDGPEDVGIASLIIYVQSYEPLF